MAPTGSSLSHYGGRRDGEEYADPPAASAQATRDDSLSPTFWVLLTLNGSFRSEWRGKEREPLPVPVPSLAQRAGHRVVEPHRTTISHLLFALFQL